MKKTFIQFARTFKSFYTGRYAVVTNTVTAGTMGFLADSVSQTVETTFSDKRWDTERSKNMTTLAIAFGPVYHYWYRFLDRKFPGISGRAVSRKVLLDLATAPAFWVVFIGSLGKMKKMSNEDIVSEFKAKAPLLLSADAIFWPILQSFNFIFVPPHYRIIALKFNELLMGILASHIVNNNYSVSKIANWITFKKDQ